MTPNNQKSVSDSQKQALHTKYDTQVLVRGRCSSCDKLHLDELPMEAASRAFRAVAIQGHSARLYEPHMNPETRPVLLEIPSQHPSNIQIQDLRVKAAATASNASGGNPLPHDSAEDEA